MSDSLRGKLLIAAPSLFDFFRRTVVLVIEHTEEGAIGVVLNRPSETRVEDAVPALAELADPEQPVWVGGPVAPDAVLALGEFGDPTEAGAVVLEGVGTVDPSAAHDSLLRMRVYAGYAGWSAGQLDGEVEEKAWIVTPAEPDDLFFEGGDLWSEALARKGGGYRLLATMPADPALN